MSLLGKTLHVKGELRTSDDITIEGHVEGNIFAQDCHVVFTPTANMAGDVIANDITVAGHINGQLVATEVVDVRAEARFTGKVLTPRFILHEAAHFVGRVEPQHLEAALRVHHYQERKKTAV